MKNKNKKINKKEVVSVTLLITTLMICGYFLFALLSWVIAYGEQTHNNKMEELDLAKEIALINNPSKNMFECRNFYPTTYGNYFLELENKTKE